MVMEQMSKSGLHVCKLPPIGFSQYILMRIYLGRSFSAQNLNTGLRNVMDMKAGFGCGTLLVKNISEQSPAATTVEHKVSLLFLMIKNRRPANNARPLTVQIRGQPVNRKSSCCCLKLEAKKSNGWKMKFGGM